MATTKKHDNVTVYRDGNFIRRVRLKFLAVVSKKGETWVAYSPTLKTFGYSDKSEKEALNDLLAALQLFVDLHRDNNTIEAALKSFGWSRRVHKKKEFRSPEIPEYQLKRGTLLSLAA